MNTRPLPYNARTWKLAALVALGLLGLLSSLALMERCFRPDGEHRARNGRSEDHMGRRFLPPEVERQSEEFWKKK